MVNSLYKKLNYLFGMNLFSRGHDPKAIVQMWVFHCKDVDPSEKEMCPHTLYTDQMDLVALTRFAKALPINNVVSRECG